MNQDQSEVIAFLIKSGSGLTRTDQSDTLQTHISVIIRFADTVLKLKRPVCFPYLDFSSPEKRYQACLKELALNRRTSPVLYLGVLRITRASDGGLEFDGPGPLVDAVLRMRRFEDQALLATMAQQGRLDTSLMTRVAMAVADSHQHAPVAQIDNGAERFRTILALNRHSEAVSAQVLGSDLPRQLNLLLAATIEQHTDVLNARALAGKVRHCHGDLHLGNLCLYQGEPLLFDCLEFNDEMATIDVLYDLAFVLMDLWQFKLPALSNWVMNRYLDLVDEKDGLPLMPFFMALRAAIRGQVMATQAAQALAAGDDQRAARCTGQSMDFFRLGLQLLEPRPVVLVAVGGLSGSGKSTVASVIAHHFGPVPGARVVSSDRLRKTQFSVSPLTRLPPQAYAADVSARVYAEQRHQTSQLLGSGVAVVADAVFSKPEGRDAIAACAADAGVPFAGIWLDVPARRLLERVAARVNDPSDADGAVVQRQLQNDVGPMNWHRVSGEGTPAEVAEAVLRHISGCLSDQRH